MEKIDISPNLFRSLDIRGASEEFVKSQNFVEGSLKSKSAYGTILNVEIAEVIGKAITIAEKPKKVVVGHDARLTSPELSKALIKGLLSQGVDVDFIGLSTTDKLYFAIGQYKYDLGVITTGSHTIKDLNGFKISKFDVDRVSPIAEGTGMENIKEIALKQDFSDKEKGKYKEINIDLDFKNFILNIIRPDKLAQAKIVFDAGNGAAGAAFEEIIDALPIESTKLYFEPDGNFPNHEPDPMIAENLTELSNKMKTKSADFGVAWDGDADRVSFIKNDGTILTGSSVAPLIIQWSAKRHKDLKVITTLPTSLASREVASKFGAKTILAKVGNSNVKIAMKSNGACLGTEEANHFMFAETFYVESGILPILIVLKLMKEKNKNFNQLLSEVLGDRVISGDINIEVHDAKKITDGLAKYYQNEGGIINKLDGVNIEFPDWHFCLRPSLNDPVVRLNLEAMSKSKMKSEIENIKSIISKLEK